MAACGSCNCTYTVSRVPLGGALSVFAATKAAMAPHEYEAALEAWARTVKARGDRLKQLLALSARRRSKQV